MLIHIMLTICIMMKLILLLLSVACFITSSAGDDLNMSGGLSCYPKPDNSTTTVFKTNLDSLLSILEEEGPRNNGFYITTTGRKSDKLYGLVQCRGDVSAQDCGTCIKGAVNETFNSCKNSNYAALWFRWCFLHYSKDYFYGQWKGIVAGMHMSFDNITTTDDPTVVITGMNLMSQLTAEVPDHPFLFKTGSVSVGQKGKRYGLVQCNKDLSKSVCGDCLTTVANFFNQAIDNSSSYTVVSNGCIMLYDRYKFYFNYSLPTSGTISTSASHTGFLISLAVAKTMFLLLLIPRTLC